MVKRGPRRPVSMADIARLAGVSVTTVSHVVNRTRSVSPETEAAVLKAIATTGYVPDNVTRSMRTSGTRTIGLAMSAISNMYFSSVVHGIEDAAAGAGYSLLYADTHDEVAGELRAVGDLLSKNVEAIILAPSANPAAALKHARAQQIPVIGIDRVISAQMDQIGCENVESTGELVQHLASIGHREVGFIAGQKGLETTKERTAGFLQAAARCGLHPQPRHVISGESTEDGAHMAFTKMFRRRGTVPSAVITANNRMTIGALRAAQDLGLDIPGDVALVGFDDFEWADVFRPRLTVVAQPAHLMGAQATSLVLSRLAHPSAAVRTVRLRPEFVHRESCGCV